MVLYFCQLNAMTTDIDLQVIATTVLNSIVGNKTAQITRMITTYVCGEGLKFFCGQSLIAPIAFGQMPTLDDQFTQFTQATISAPFIDDSHTRIRTERRQLNGVVT